MIDRNAENDSESAGQRDQTSLIRDEVLQRQDADWSRGVRTSIDQLINAYPVLRVQSELLLDVIYNEVYLRHERGETPELSDYQRQFPALSDALRILFQLDDWMLRQAGDSVDRASSETISRHRIGRYVIQSKLGEGGIGVAYKAWDPVLRRVVALKVLKSGRFASEHEVARFRTEAEAIARIRHENVVQVYDVGQIEGEPFIAMEFCAGGTLADRLRQQIPAPREAAAIVLQISRGLATVHQMQIIHRDVKPANVFLQAANPSSASSADTPQDSRDTLLDSASFVDPAKLQPTLRLQQEVAKVESMIPKISDFGLARLVDYDERQTRTGMLLGTPAYMAPEQAFGGQIDVTYSIDVYALGAVLYECLTGRPPFQGLTPAETLDQVRTREPTPMVRLQPGIPVDLQTIASKCLSKDPRNRYVSVAEVAAELGRFLDGQPIVARPISRLERIWRWCRRNPGIAGLSSSVFALMMCLTIGAIWAAILLRTEATAARQSEQKAIKADAQRLEKLYQAYLGESRASRRSGGLGQRETGLESIRGILTAYSDKVLSQAQRLELRDEAIAALALPDLRTVGQHRAEIIQETCALETRNVFGAYPIWNRETGAITVHRATDGEILGRLPGIPPLVNETRWFVFSECGTWLLEICDLGPTPASQRVRMWDWRKGDVVFDENYQTAWAQVVAHPATRKIIAYCRDSRLRRFDLMTGIEEGVSPGEFKIFRMALDSSGQRLATVNDQTQAQIVDARTWQALDVLRDARPARAVDWHPSGNAILIGCIDSSLYEWNAVTRQGRYWPRQESAEISDLWYCPTGDCVAIALPGDVILRDRDWAMPQVPGMFMGFDVTGHRIASLYENEVTWYERDRDIVQRQISAHAEFCEYSPDGRWLMLSGPHEVRILETQNYSEVAVVPIDRPGPVVFDPRGRDLVTFGIMSHPWLWPITKPDRPDYRSRFGPPSPLPIKHFRDLKPPDNKPEPEPEHFGRHVSFSADGQKLAVAGARYREILVWERGKDPEPRLFLKTHAAERVAMSPDGRWLAGAAEHGPVGYVWDYETQRQMLQVPDARRVAFSADGRWLVMATWDRVQLYACDPSGTFQHARTLERAQPARLFSTAIAISPDSRYLAMTGSESQIRLVELQTGRIVGNLTYSEGAIVSWMSFSPDGRLAAARPGFGVTIWNLAQLNSGLSSLGVDHSGFPDLSPRSSPGDPSASGGVEVDRGLMPPPAVWSDHWLRLAEHEISEQNLNDAIGDMSAAIDTSPQDDWPLRKALLCRRAAYYQRNRNYQQAKADLENALLFARDSRDVKVAISRLVLFGPPEVRDPLRAQDLLAPLLLKPGNQTSETQYEQEWQLFGCALIRFHQHKEGLLVLSQHPSSADDPAPKYMQALAHHYLSEHEVARQTFQSAVEIEEKARPTAPPELQVEWERFRLEVEALIRTRN